MGFKTGSHGKVYNDDKKSHGSSSNHPGNNDGSSFTMKDYDANLTDFESSNGGDIKNALALAKKYGTKSEVADMESMLSGYERTGNTYNFEYDEMNRIDAKYFHKFDKEDKS